MRPPGYPPRDVRPLPFDSLDRLIAAAGVDLALWRGVRTLDDRAEQVDLTGTDNRLDGCLLDLAEGHL